MKSKTTSQSFRSISPQWREYTVTTKYFFLRTKRLCTSPSHGGAASEFVWVFSQTRLSPAMRVMSRCGPGHARQNKKTKDLAPILRVWCNTACHKLELRGIQMLKKEMCVLMNIHHMRLFVMLGLQLVSMSGDTCTRTRSANMRAKSLIFYATWSNLVLRYKALEVRVFRKNRQTRTSALQCRSNYSYWQDMILPALKVQWKSIWLFFIPEKTIVLGMVFVKNTGITRGPRRTNDCLSIAFIRETVPAVRVSKETSHVWKP